MIRPEWGQKRRCAGEDCGAVFYDMKRTPIMCPKCGAEHKPTLLLKPRSTPAAKPRRKPAVPAMAVEDAPAADVAAPDTDLDGPETLDPAPDDEIEVQADEDEVEVEVERIG